MAPEEVEMFTPGGMGATLSPISAIFFTTTPPKGARITVFWSWASEKARSAFAWATWASAMRTRLAAASRWSTETIFCAVRSSASFSCRTYSARSASARCTAACARTTAAS